MTDYERTTTRESTTVDPAVPAGYPAEPAAAASVRTTERAYTPAGPSGLSTLARIVTFAFGILQAVLILRIILLLLVANQGNDIVSLILGITDPFVEPFRGMFSIDRVTAGQGSRLDIAAIVALIGWTLVELLVLALLRIFTRRPADTV
ncbi:MAG: YggT family protein [Chloroflexi bacterium]|nr:YggT family protein [Chloroflexota bacterium]